MMPRDDLNNTACSLLPLTIALKIDDQDDEREKHKNPFADVKSPSIRRLQRQRISISLEDIHATTTSNGDVPDKLDPGKRMSEITSSELSIGSTESEDDTLDDVTLMYARHEKLPLKDFAAEIRAIMDVESFLKSAVLLLDVTETNQTEIVEHMLLELLGGDEEDNEQTQAAKRVLFTHDKGDGEFFIHGGKNYWETITVPYSSVLHVKKFHSHNIVIGVQKVHIPCKMIQGTSTSAGGGMDYDQSWMCLLCSLPFVQKRRVAIARLKNPTNLGRTSQEIQLIILIVTPTKEKGTKNALETGRTFSTIFADMELRQKLLECVVEEDFKQLIWEHTKALVEYQARFPSKAVRSASVISFIQPQKKDKICPLGNGLLNDLRRRIPHYISDYKDGVFGHRTMYKLVSTTFFLYFACLLPCIALGQLNYKNTHGAIDVRKVIFSQTIGGLFFALVGGQPLIIMLTTAPLALYTKVIFEICHDFDIDFLSMFACVGLWNSFFLIVYAIGGASRLMTWSTRSSEEIFALFISIAFIVDACKDIYKTFDKHYMNSACFPPVNTTNMTAALSNLSKNGYDCNRESSLLFLLLVFGTLWLGVTLYNFTKTPFLNPGKREVLADYALPVAVLVMSFVGSFLFRDIKMDSFDISSRKLFDISPFWKLSWGMILASMGLGFSLSLLFFMDQNISSAVVNAPQNKLKKGSAYHWDLFVVATMNGILSLFGLPWVHAALPHSPLHVKALADMEERVDQGHVYQIVVRVRETRLTGIIANAVIGISILMIPVPLTFIPSAVLNGVFLFIAITALDDNQMYERLLLLLTEQNAYPPNHYIRRVPQRKVHLFTFTQLIQLLILCAFGFSPISYMKMVFPLLIMLLIPIRQKLVPKIIEAKFLDALDGHL